MSEKQEINNTRQVAFRPVLFAFLLAGGITIGLNVNREGKDKFSQIFDIIQNDYVDSTKAEMLKENTIEYLLSQLDPHSAYIPAELSEINERQIRGNYEGLGIEYISFRDTLFVFNTFSDGPAEKAGLKAGDRLLKADNTNLTDTLSNSQIQQAMQGTEGSRVNLLVYRRSTNRYLNFKISRSTITMNSSEIYYMVSKTLGYIQLERFSSNTHQEFLSAINNLKQQGMKDLILDLRNNGGGLLNEAVAIANEFLQKNEVISYTYGMHRKRNDYVADGNGIFKDGKLILLINHNTASASEILAGSLQDNDRAIIMGNRSFGKGLVQEPFRLSDGSIIRLTIARYYTPSGRSIQKSYNKNIETYRNEIYKRNMFKDTLNPVLDSSVSKDFFTKNGRILIVGGGIRPDIFLRDTINDSTEIEMLMPGLFYSRIFDIYLMDYMHNELGKVSAVYKDIFLFQNLYRIDTRFVVGFIEVARKIPYLHHLTYSPKTEDIVKKYLKAAIAYRIFGEIGRSQIINREEDVFSKSFEVLKNYERILNIGKQKQSNFDY